MTLSRPGCQRVAQLCQKLPTAPFGVSWYQADIPINQDGHGHVRVIGKLSKEAFTVARGSAPAPVTFTSQITS